MNDQAKQYQQLIAKCWADDAFKQRLLADPAGTLAAEGMAVPEGVTLRVVENTAQALTLVIPPRPTELTDEALAGAVGGSGGSGGESGIYGYLCVDPCQLSL